MFSAIKIKILPESPDEELEDIEKEAQEKIKEEGGKVSRIEQEPVAFGLKAIIITLAWPEEKETDLLERILEDIKGVSSTQIIDHRRAFG